MGQLGRSKSSPPRDSRRCAKQAKARGLDDQCQLRPQVNLPEFLAYCRAASCLFMRDLTRSGRRRWTDHARSIAVPAAGMVDASRDPLAVGASACAEPRATIATDAPSPTHRGTPSDAAALRLEPNELEPTIAEIEAMIAAAQGADAHDKYLTAWRAELSADERRRSKKNLEAFVAEAGASLRECASARCRAVVWPATSSPRGLRRSSQLAKLATDSPCRQSIFVAFSMV